MEETKIKPKLLILTGPQGSGNHLFAKLFSLHSMTEGWNMMREEWQGHHEEPFAAAWNRPALLKDKPWDSAVCYVTSISCPYIKDKEPHIPKYKEFITEAKKYCDVRIAIIGRDRNILKLQQERLRGGATTPQAIAQFEQLPALAPTHYISQELFYLYGQEYLKSLEKQMDFPIAWNYHSIMLDYLKRDANRKYTQQAEGKFDVEVKKACDES